jgi:hypothetical protein
MFVLSSSRMHKLVLKLIESRSLDVVVYCPTGSARRRNANVCFDGTPLR